MSNFLKKGKRQATIKNKKEVKQRTKEVYKILNEMEEVAQAMVKEEIIITEDNVVEEAAKYTDREISGLEKFILLGKTHQYYESLKIKEDERDETTKLD